MTRLRINLIASSTTLGLSLLEIIWIASLVHPLSDIKFCKMRNLSVAAGRN